MKFSKFYIYFVSFALINCAPADYDGIDIMPSDVYDIDTEQLQARYDPRLLSEDVSGYHSTSNEEASSCRNSNVRYVHGQKVPRTDPCEICLCVDGEIFCWWKKCDHPVKKQQKPYKPQHHTNTHNHHYNKNRKSPQNPWLKNIPKTVLNFPQHLPTHILDDIQEEEDEEQNTSNEEADDIDTSSDTSINGKLNKNMEIEMKPAASSSGAASNDEPSSNLLLSTVIKADMPENVHSSSVSKSSGITSENLVKSSGNRNIDTNEPPANEQRYQTSSNGENINDKLRIITVNPIIIDNKITEDAFIRKTTQGIIYGGSGNGGGGGGGDSSDGTPSYNLEKGYYEKTIINKNGVFIENIRKIVNIDDDNEMKITTIESEQPQDNEENINRKNIELMNVPLSQHYVITSSGKIEKSDALAGDDVIAQFRDGLLSSSYNDFQQQQQQQPTIPPPSYAVTAATTLGLYLNNNYNSSGHNGNATAFNSNNNTATVSLVAAAVPTSSSAASVSTTLVLDDNNNNNNNNNNNAAGEAVDDKPPFNCIVMGKSYTIGTILPQESGNCLQCVCSPGTPEDINPRVTCSSHNCPPLILPDLFDATGY